MELDLNPEQQLIRDTARDFAMAELEPHAQEWDEHHISPATCSTAWPSLASRA